MYDLLNSRNLLWKNGSLELVSESGTFSEMKEYNSATETEKCKSIVFHILKEYWKNGRKRAGIYRNPIENLIEWDELEWGRLYRFR